MMWPYFILIIIPGIISGINYLNKKKIRRVLPLLVFFTILISLLCLRNYSVGVDINNYIFIFNREGVKKWKDFTFIDDEILYALLNKFSYLISKDFRLLLVIIALMTTIPIYKIYKTDSDNLFLIIIIFVNMPNFVLLFSGLRQAIAISLGCLAFLLIKRRRIFLSVLVVLTAMLFHVSAFVLFLLYPLYFIKIRKTHLLLLIPLFFVTFIYNKQILIFFISLLPDKYQNYTLTYSGAYSTIFLFCSFLVFSFIVMDSEKADKDSLFFRNVLLLSAFIQLFAPWHPLAMRFNYYFIIFIPLAISRTIKYSKVQFRSIANLAKIIMIGFFVLYYFYYAYTGADILNVYPYYFL